MANRCPSCNKFVSLAVDPDAELSDDASDLDNFTVEAKVEVQDCCADCGEVLRTGELDLEAEILEEDFTDKAVYEAWCDDSAESESWTITLDDPTADEVYHPIPDGRHRKPVRFITVEVGWLLSDKDNHTIAMGHLRGEIAASELEEF